LPRIAVVVLGVGVVLLTGAFCLKWVPEWLATDGLRGKDRAEEVGRTRTAVLVTLAGLIATVGAVFTGLTYRLNQKGHELDRAGQITERFTRAIDQLGNESLDVRLGGIYALERIARDSAEDHPQVMEVLAAYVRQNAPAPHMTAERLKRMRGEEALPDEAVSELPKRRTVATDINAAVSVVARRDASRDRRGARVDLRKTELLGLELTTQPEEDGASLEGANLSAAHLERSNLRRANLRQASLVGTQLQGANLSQGHLEAASLVWADLEGANLKYAHLQDASLSGAYLKNADLTGAYLHGADLASEAGNAVLAEANLTRVRYDDDTIWPEGFRPPPRR
jgi:hypothetical protein